MEAALAVIRRGGIVGFPTDTVFGVGVDPYSETAVDALYRLKNRPALKPMALLVASVEQAIALAEFNVDAFDLVKQWWPGGLTIVLPRLEVCPRWLGDRRRNTIGLRCPDHPVALEFLSRSGPLVVTSANHTGEPAATDEVGARAVFGDTVCLYLEGSSPGGCGSTVVDLTEPTRRILRSGPVDGFRLE